MTTERSETIRSLARGLHVLSAINRLGAASLNQLHQETRISRQAILRILATLEEEGYVRRWLNDGLYRISSISPGVSRNFAQLTLMADIIAPSQVELMAQLDWPTDVAVLDGDRMAVCETTRRQSPFPFPLVRAGHRVHILQSAVGRVYLAFMEEPEREALLTRLRLSLDPYDTQSRKREAVARLVEKVRSDGFGVREPGYVAPGSGHGASMQALALPIFQGARVAACLSATWFARALSVEEFVERHLHDIKAAVAKAEMLIASSGIELQA